MLSHQPFNDRQAIVTFTGSEKAGIGQQCDIYVAGAGINTYPQLNQYDASVMSTAQLIDNLARALYEINQNLQAVSATLSSQALTVDPQVRENKEQQEEHIPQLDAEDSPPARFIIAQSSLGDFRALNHPTLHDTGGKTMMLSSGGSTVASATSASSATNTFSTSVLSVADNNVMFVEKTPQEKRAKDGSLLL